jgi:DNA primase/energy-coupling factor transporter ATP-binding protein EcfA2
LLASSQVQFFFLSIEKRKMSIPELKERLTIGMVLAHYGLQPNAKGMLACPFHADDKPSMKVYTETNTVYCFAGSCRVSSLDVIDFVMLKEGCSKHQAILKAKELVGSAGQLPLPIFEAVEPTTDTVSESFAKYLKAMQSHAQAQSYCTERGLDWHLSPLGGAGGGIGYKSRKTGDKWARGCIIFPLYNPSGEVVSLYGRAVAGTGHYYQTNRCGLYPSYPDPSTKVLVLCESVIDAATLGQVLSLGDAPPLEVKGHGGAAVLALYGTNGMTAEHRQAIKGLKDLQEIVFALDGDEAGRQATRIHAQVLGQVCPKIKLSTLVLPEGEDLNSLAVAHEDKQGLFRELFNQRQVIEVATTKPVEAVSTSRAGEELDTQNPYHLRFATATARYAIKGGLRLSSKDLDSMKVTLVVENEAGLKSRQKLDLYEDKQVEKISRLVGEKLGLRADLVEIDLQHLTDALDDYRQTLQDQEQPHQAVRVQVPVALRSACLDFLKAPRLLERINDHIGKSGVAGEQTNRLLLFVVASSYQMPHTLHALIQGASGSGKTRLAKVISELMPPESVKRYTRVTDGSFYNQGEYYFKNKLLCFEDIDGLKEDALLAVRELQSNEILITSTSIKDESGSIRGGERIVRGPIASLACTTKAELYEDNISRCFVVAVDESREQSLRIIRYQNDQSAGVIDMKQEQETRRFLQHCIRLLEPYEVINPFANRITLPEEAHKIRRLNELYQSFVRQVTLLHQHQRKREGQGRLITQVEDLEAACDILFESIVLKVDELDGSLRQFFEQLKTYVRSKSQDYEFDRFEVRGATGVSKTQQHRYLSQLVQLEYLRQYGFANRGYRYRIVHWDDMSKVRTDLKAHLQKQLGMLRNANGTPDKAVKRS